MSCTRGIVDQVVAIAQDQDARIYSLAGTGAHQAVGLGNGTAAPLGAAGPGRSPAAGGPVRTQDHIVAVRQGRHPAHRVARVGADETVAFGNGTRDPLGAAAPGHSTAVAVPGWALGRVAAVAQARESTAGFAHK